MGIHFGETIRRLDTRLDEHREACRRGELEKSAIAEHVWRNQHVIKWNETSLLGKSSLRIHLMVKEALQITLSPATSRINRGQGIEIPISALNVASDMISLRLRGYSCHG